MATVPHPEADRYLARPNRGHFIFLFFGSDQGVRSERSHKLLRSLTGNNFQTLQIIDVAADLIADDPFALLDEANALSLFNTTPRVIRILIGNQSILPGLELVSKTPPAECVLLLEGGDLKRDAPLRKWVDKHDFAAAVECRADDARDIQRLIDSEIKAANVAIEPDARETLGAILGEDRLSTRSAIGKLLLYTHGQTTITRAHVDSLLTDSSILSIDAVISSLFSSRPALVLGHLTKALQSGADINLILNNALRYAISLHRGRAEFDSGAPFDEALKNILRNVNGYDRKAEIALHLRHTEIKKLSTIMDVFSEIIKSSRRSHFLSEERVSRLFLAVTSLLKVNGPSP